MSAVSAKCEAHKRTLILDFVCQHIDLLAQNFHLQISLSYKILVSSSEAACNKLLHVHIFCN